MNRELWAWAPHPEVWVLVVSIVALGVYAVRVIGPKVVPAGPRGAGAPGVVVTRRQKGWFVLGVLLLWVAADWPVHDAGERALYSVHMGQHLLMSLVVAPVFLLATPTWLARLIIGDGSRAGRAVRVLCRPVVAGVIFNAVLVFLHWPAAVNGAVDSAALHFSLHLLLVGSALLMWVPVCGPLPELRLSLPGQMLYLFCMSIVPTIPSAWLIFAENPVYREYGLAAPLYGVDPINDQQVAGVIMKLVGGFFLWGLIVALWFRWAHRHMEADRHGIRVSERDVLTWEQVERELAATPSPTES